MPFNFFSIKQIYMTRSVSPVTICKYDNPFLSPKIFWRVSFYRRSSNVPFDKTLHIFDTI